MDLIRNSLHMNKTKGKTVFSITIDEDITIPEGKSGIDHKIKDMGEVCLEKVRAMEDRVNVGGCLYFGMLYQSDDGCQSYYGKIPFDETTSMSDVNSQDMVSGKASLYDLKISIISSHKISVRAVISIVLVAESVYEKDAVSGIDMKNVQCRKKENNFLKMVSGKKETFRIRESVNIDNGMPDIEEIMWQDMHIENMEIKSGDRIISLNGNMVIFAIYRGDKSKDAIYFTEKIPFTGNIEISDARQGDIYDINVISLEKSLIARNDANGETRIMDGELIMTIDVHGYREEHTSLLYDMYAPLWELKPQKEEVEYETFLVSNRVECRSEDVSSAELQGKIVYTATNAVIEDVITEKGSVNVIGVITADVFSQNTEDGNTVNVLRRDIPFSKKIEIDDLDDKCTVNTKIENIQTETRKTGQSELTISCNYDISVFAKKTVRENIITDVEYKEIPKEYLKTLPGIAGYIVKEGDTLWDIAKKYCTTTEEIMEINHLESEEVYPGMKLLIVKLYCF